MVVSIKKLILRLKNLKINPYRVSRQKAAEVEPLAKWMDAPPTTQKVPVPRDVLRDGGSVTVAHDRNLPCPKCFDPAADKPASVQSCACLDDVLPSLLTFEVAVPPGTTPNTALPAPAKAVATTTTFKGLKWEVELGRGVVWAPNIVAVAKDKDSPPRSPSSSAPTTPTQSPLLEFAPPPILPPTSSLPSREATPPPPPPTSGAFANRSTPPPPPRPAAPQAVPRADPKTANNNTNPPPPQQGRSWWSRWRKPILIGAAVVAVAGVAVWFLAGASAAGAAGAAGAKAAGAAKAAAAAAAAAL